MKTPDNTHKYQNKHGEREREREREKERERDILFATYP
jgi:hypothetical protein